MFAPQTGALSRADSERTCSAVRMLKKQRPIVSSSGMLCHCQRRSAVSHGCSRQHKSCRLAHGLEQIFACRRFWMEEHPKTACLAVRTPNKQKPIVASCGMQYHWRLPSAVLHGCSQQRKSCRLAHGLRQLFRCQRFWIEGDLHPFVVSGSTSASSGGDEGDVVRPRAAAACARVVMSVGQVEPSPSPCHAKQSLAMPS